MKTIQLLVIALFTAFLTMSTARAADIELLMSASPSKPIIGEDVTWTISSTGGDSLHRYIWNSPDISETLPLFNWGGGPYPHYFTKSFTFKYSTAGTKSITVTAASMSGNHEITRTLSLMVFEGRLTMISPIGSETWQVGKFYPIRWKTEGNVPNVEVALWDDRYQSEVGNTRSVLIARSISNTGCFWYLVPKASPTGISGGNLGSRSYKVSVNGFNSVAGAMSPDCFTIIRR